MSKEEFMDALRVDLKDPNYREALRRISGIDRDCTDRILKGTRRNPMELCFLREDIFEGRIVSQISFGTAGCRLKKAGSCWNCNYGVADNCITTPKQYVKAFKKILPSISGETLVLDSAGSITDPEEFSTTALYEIFKLAVESRKFRTIIIETHVTQIPEEFVANIQKLNSGKSRIMFEIGVEDLNPNKRRFINKIGVTNKKVQEVYDLLTKYGIGLEINLIYGLPFMQEEERIKSVLESLEYMVENMPDAEPVIFLMSVKDNTFLKWMKENNYYEMPNPWGLPELIKRILNDEKLSKMPPPIFSWFGEKQNLLVGEETCYTCDNCKAQIVEALSKINGTFNNEKRRKILEELVKNADTCHCYQKFLEELEKSDGKTPSERYLDFLEAMSSKGDGEIGER